MKPSPSPPVKIKQTFGRCRWCGAERTAVHSCQLQESVRGAAQQIARPATKAARDEGYHYGNASTSDHL